MSNSLKVIIDCLKGAAFHDDNQIVSIYAHRHEDKENPRVVVEIGEAK